MSPKVDLREQQRVNDLGLQKKNNISHLYVTRYPFFHQIWNF